MRTQTLSVWTISLGCFLALGAGPAERGHAPAQLSLDLTTIHAAVLTSARSPADSTDAPYLLVSIVGSGGRTEAHALPAGGRWAMRQDQAITGLSIASISLQPGDSVRVLVSLLEDRATLPEEFQIATAMTSHRSMLSPLPSLVTTALTPLTSRGAHWLGSASLLLINVGGTTYWSSLDCVASCTVLQPPAAGGTGAVLENTAPRPASGVVELTGASGTYHLAVALKRVS